jgi:type I restriction enzyme, S subunit
MTATFPTHWKCIKLKDIVLEHAAGIYKSKEEYGEGTNIIGVADLYDISSIDGQEFRRVQLDKEEAERFTLHEGDLIYGESSIVKEGIARALYVTKEGAGTAFAWHTRRYKIDTKQLLPIFLYYYLTGDFARKYIMSVATQTALTGITVKDYFDIPIYYPPSIDEQEKISFIIADCDKVITLTKKLIATMQQRRKALVQRLLFEKNRFKDFQNKDWETVSLSQILTPKLRKIEKPNSNYSALGIRSHGKGTFIRNDVDPETVSLTELYEVKPGDLIVNITFAWEGAIAIVQQKDDGCLVSHRFPTYEFNYNKVDPSFFQYLMVTKEFIYDLGLISPGGAGRNRVLSKKDFLRLRIKLPSLKEQRRIADVLVSSESEINLAKEKLDYLEKQKKSILQRFLNGQIRVKV